MAAPPQVVAQTLGRSAAVIDEAAAGEIADLDAVRRVADELTRMDVAHGQALEASVRFLAVHLAPCGQAGRDVVAAFAGGFVAACVDQSVTRQAALHRAALTAQREDLLRVVQTRRENLAQYDPVTGAGSRQLLLQRLEQAGQHRDSTRRLGLCVVDLGCLPHVQDQYGTTAADQIAIVVAGLLSQLAADGHYLLARHTDTGFALLVENSGGLAHMVDLAEEILAALSGEVPLAGLHEVAVGLEAVVGVVDTACPAVLPRQVLVDANDAVARARAESRSWVVADPAAGGFDRRTVGWLPGFARTPTRYAPILNPDGVLRGWHCRPGWSHPQRGLVSLAEIGAYTADLDMLILIIRGVVNEACYQAAVADPDPDGPYVGVHLPLRSIPYLVLRDVVQNALDRSGLPAHRLHIFVFGIDAVPAGAYSHTVFSTLDELGVRIEIDDFGVDATTIKFLQDLPIAGLRTPISIVAGAEPSGRADRSGELLAGIAEIAHALQATLTVHGIACAQQHQQVAASGCDRLEGPHYGAPVTADALAAAATAATALCRPC